MACKSKRCLQAGNCTCNYIDDLGNPVLGTGTVTSPHRHDRQKVKCILDYKGNQLVPNVNREVVIPEYISSVELGDGTILTPDKDGNVILPTSGIGIFFLQDQEGRTISVVDDALVSFSMDGDESVSYAEPSIESPIFNNNNVILPSGKVRTYSSDWPELWDGITTFQDTNQDLVVIQSDQLFEKYYFPGSVDLSRSKSTVFVFHYTLNLFEVEKTVAPNYSPGSGNDEFVFDLNVYLNPDSDVSPISLQQGASWTPDYGFGQKSYYGAIPIVANGSDSSDIGAVEIDVKAGTYVPRTLVAHLSGALQWV